MNSETAKGIIERANKRKAFQVKNGRTIHFHCSRKITLEEYGFTEILKDVFHTAKELDICKLQKALTARSPHYYVHPDSHTICNRPMPKYQLSSSLICPGWMVHDVYETAVSEAHFYEFILTIAHNYESCSSGKFGLCPECPPPRR